MTKAILEQIERQLSELDVEAMSFDHEEAEQCKAALVRIVDQAVKVCRGIDSSAMTRKRSTEPRRWTIDHDAAIRQQQSFLQANSGPRTIEGSLVGSSTIGGKILVNKQVPEEKSGPTAKPRRSISVGKGNSDD